MDLANTIASIGAGVIEARKRANVEAITGADGMEYCKKCGEPLLLELKITGPIAERLGSVRYVPRNCSCMRAMFDEENARQERQKREETIRRQRMESLKSEKYCNSTFDKDDGRAPVLRKTCESYVAKRKEIIQGNMGMAFLGGNGSGKTFWASCIANSLIEAGATVYMTTLTKLIAEMNANHGESRDAIERKIRNVDFLILDDYGAERGTEFSLEQAFEVLDTRYGAEKPLIITANLTETILKNPPNINYARSYSRIIEMCPALIKVEGERREALAAEKRKLLADIMRSE